MKDTLAVADMHAGEELRATFDALNPPGMAVSNVHNTSGWMKGAVPGRWETRTDPIPNP